MPGQRAVTKTQRRKLPLPGDGPCLAQRIVLLACPYGRRGYRRVTVLLRRDGRGVNHRRVARVVREQLLKVSRKQPPGEAVVVQ